MREIRFLIKFDQLIDHVLLRMGVKIFVQLKIVNKIKCSFTGESPLSENLLIPRFFRLWRVNVRRTLARGAINERITVLLRMVGWIFTFFLVYRIVSEILR